MNELKVGNNSSFPAYIKRGRREIRNSDFGKIIKQAIRTLNNAEKEADKSVIDFLSGKSSIHETMIAIQKADISLKLFLNFRNKAIEAYKEIMHMQF